MAKCRQGGACAGCDPCAAAQLRCGSPAFAHFADLLSRRSRYGNVETADRGNGKADRCGGELAAASSLSTTGVEEAFPARLPFPVQAEAESQARRFARYPYPGWRSGWKWHSSG